MSFYPSCKITGVMTSPTAGAAGVVACKSSATSFTLFQPKHSYSSSRWGIPRKNHICSDKQTWQFDSFYIELFGSILCANWNVRKLMLKYTERVQPSHVMLRFFPVMVLLTFTV